MSQFLYVFLRRVHCCLNAFQSQTNHNQAAHSSPFPRPDLNCWTEGSREKANIRDMNCRLAAAPGLSSRFDFQDAKLGSASRAVSICKIDLRSAILALSLQIFEASVLNVFSIMSSTSYCRVFLAHLLEPAILKLHVTGDLTPSL